MSEDGATKTAHRAAQQVTAVDLDDFKRSLINEGVFHALVEGGFHSEALSDDEAEFLAVLITEEGVIGLKTSPKPTTPASTASRFTLPNNESLNVH